MLLRWTVLFFALATVAVAQNSTGTSGIYSGPCQENCCCKVCSAPSNEAYPYGITTEPIQGNPTNPKVSGASCKFPIWSDRSYNDTSGNPVTPPDTLWWESFAVFGDFDRRSAPTTCACCRLSVDTSCSEERPRATRPKQFYVVGGRAVEYRSVSLVFELGVELTTGDYVELRNDTFCGYTHPMYVLRSNQSHLTVAPDAQLQGFTTTTYAIPRLPSDGCYRVCYFHSTLTTPTWYDLGTLTVYNEPNAAVAFQVDPLDVMLEGNSVTITFMGRSLLSVFDDIAELRTAGACGSGGPTTDTTGSNGILEVTEGHEWCKPKVQPGITSLRPLNFITPDKVKWTVTLPAAASYRLCYRLQGTWYQLSTTFAINTANSALVALQALYTATNGATTWTRNTGWAGTDPCAMYGVRCSGTDVVSINLGRNNLEGTLPPAFFRAQYFLTLEYIALDENQISGSVPHEIGALRNLKYLNLGVNQITGALPASLQRTSLQHLYAPMNNLDGSVPVALSDMPLLWTEYNTQMVDATKPVVTPLCPYDPMECSDRGSTDVGVFECGYASITEAECLTRGCCFNPQAPLVFGGTSCFTKRSAFLDTNPVCENSINCKSLAAVVQ